MREFIQIIENANQQSRFAQWFGDSKVISSDGKPLVVYHGSNAHAYVGGEIDIFHTLPASGRGAAFFSSSKSLAGEYGEKIYEVYLRIVNPLIVFGNGKSWTSLDDKTKIGGRITDELRAHHQKKAEVSNKNSKELNDIFRELSSMDGVEHSDISQNPKPSSIPDDADELDNFNLNIITGNNGGWGIETDAIVKQARKMGYDGVIFKDINDSPTHDRNLYKNTPTDVYAVFHPGQIKSINNNGKWDSTDPDIKS